MSAPGKSVGSTADYDSLQKEQRIKAALYFGIKQIAREVEEEMEVSVSAQVLATLSESLNRQVASFATDLELFAKHAKRSTVNIDDVKLLARKNSTLLEHLESMVDEQSTHKKTNKGSKKSVTKGKISNTDKEDDAVHLDDI